ncbi:MinD superfamily P-loop ATPase containing an inserted ferredoxin domain [Candidatus Syntrophocurvum alkaliphilum]|uniref:MinD superfamily P-loop ATPase containing an inserted ferredoxin domain n=1 Tax=Candidatus Syntrophocurvum alkaliphilum TaxID=2293317 RepID=A0A6I6DL90_9FIRM|nr:ATP-binding protein [Candidatus Syntrophocurvum alkaliphilum]QGU00205.1 MinD superfamily P-loop ATPase containing an inserted ferredoxin domain [Candidatus Syntrophocurvum alkaliphilum]
MKEILVISGKGGAGKTALSSSFISLVDKCIACDYDVDASNLPILLKPNIKKEHEYSGAETAVIKKEQCIECGLCSELCRFDAIEEFKVNDLLCEGCAFCSRICPTNAIYMTSVSSGKWFESISEENKLTFYGELRPGEENSGKLVAQIKQAAIKKSDEKNIPLIISDGSPGIGCSVISSLVGVNLVVLVAEPNISGFHDMKRVYELVEKYNIKTTLIINKYDLNEVLTKEIEKWAINYNIKLLGKIPFSLDIVDQLSNTKIPVYNPKIYKIIKPIWDEVMAQI